MESFLREAGNVRRTDIYSMNFLLYLITDRNQTNARTIEQVVEEACASGVRAVQVRERDLDAGSLLDLSRRLRKITAAHGAMLFINDRIDVTLLSDADGVHLRESSVTPSEARRLLDAKKLIGASIHSYDKARQAERDGADFLLLGPVFETLSKAVYGAPLGLETLSEVTRSISIPVYAVGGITPDRARACIEAGAYGVAAVSAVCRAQNIPEAIRQFRHALTVL